MANTDTTIKAVTNPQNNNTPIDISATIKALERNKFIVKYFEHPRDATAYLANRIQNKRVALGDSRTLLELGVYDALVPHNIEVTDIHRPLSGESFRETALRTMGRDVFNIRECTFTNRRNGKYRRYRQSHSSLSIWI